MPLTGFVCDLDGDPVTVSITSITSDEPTKKNNGDPAPDADPDCIDTDTARLRPERDGGSDGRVYVVNFTASDGRGGETELSLPVRVPHDYNDYKDGCAAGDNGQKYDATKISLRGGKKKKK